MIELTIPTGDKFLVNPSFIIAIKEDKFMLNGQVTHGCTVYLSNDDSQYTKETLSEIKEILKNAN